jgi:ELWxxDGT repeat protein
MKKLLALFTICIVQCTIAQNPKVIKTVSGTQTYPGGTAQESWINNQWNGLFFYAGTGLCVTDGTAAGTKFLTTVGAGSIQRILPAKDFVYIFTAQLISASPFTYRYQIWKSDGTTVGTTLVTTLPDAIGISNLNQFCSDGASVFNYSLDGTTNTMYFGAYDGVNGNELWVTDGTAAGTHIVKDIKTGAGGSNPWGFFKIGNEVFFNCNEVGFEKKMWKTDGTEAGTVKVPVAEPFFIVNGNVGKLGNKILFYANNTINGYEPYVSDGTAAGTFMLKDINPSGNSLLAAGQEMHLKSNSKFSFFIANNGTDTTLWRTDGTTLGTIRLSPTGTTYKNNVSSGGYSDIDESGLWMLEYNAGGTGNSEKIYKSDGTIQGTYLAGQNISYGQKVKIYKNALWMQARNIGSAVNAEPWRCGGNQATTNIAFEVRPENSGSPTFAPFSSDPFGFFVKNNKLYFFATRSSGPTVNLYEYNGDFTFNGGLAGGRWSDSANWNSMMPPGITDTVFINSGTPNALNINGTTAYASVLNIGNNTTINFTNSTDSLIVNTKLVNGTTTNITGSGVVAFRNITNDTVKIENGFTANNVAVQSNTNLTSGAAVINNNINLTAGKLFLNNNNFALTGNTSTVTTTPGSYIATNGTGSLQIQNIGTGARVGAVTFPIGTSTDYLPVTFTNSGDADNFTARVINTANQNYIGETPSGQQYVTGAVNNTWFVNEANNGGSNVTIELQWNTAQELNLFDRTQSYLGHYTGGVWNLGVQGSATGSNPYSFSRSNITSFSPFGIFNNNAVLPLNFHSFNAQKCNTSQVCLTWKTANEQNVSHFEIERSVDGVSFSKAGTKTANNLSQNTYTATDDISTIQTKQLYYRIKQVDINGKTANSTVQLIKLQSSDQITIYPNPVTDEINMVNWNKIQQVQLVDITGKIVKQWQAVTSSVLNVSGITSGFYLLKIILKNEKIQTQKIIKQ